MGATGPPLPLLTLVAKTSTIPPPPPPSCSKMASAVVNNLAALSPDPFLDCPPSAGAAFPSCGWLSPSRISFSRSLPPPPSECEAHVTGGGGNDDDPDAAGKDIVFDFEFRLHDPVAMLPADELFSDGKLVPLQLAAAKLATDRPAVSAAEIRSPESPKTRRKIEIPGPDPYAFSPRAPRCTTRWRELLGFRRSQSPKPADPQKASSAISASAAAAAAAGASATRSPNHRSMRSLLHRNAKPASLDSALSLPLLRDSDSESLSISSSRLSLSSSSSSGQDHEDLPRLSLDSDLKVPIYHSRNAQPPPIRLVRPRTSTSDGVTHHARASRAGRNTIRRATEVAPPPPRGVSIDSPRMISSGKIVFQSLERSSSSPGSFTGGPRPRPRGMERSYSAHVRVAPVLNVVPVCSLRGSAKSVSVFGLSQMFSPQKKDKEAPASAPPQIAPNRPGSTQHGKTKTDRVPRDHHHQQVKGATTRDHSN